VNRGRLAACAVGAALTVGGFGLAGCGDEEETTTTSTEPTVSSTELTVDTVSTTTESTSSTTSTTSTTQTGSTTTDTPVQEPAEDSEENDTPPEEGSPEAAFEEECEKNPEACG
jgi:hypothetical protein